MAGRLILVSDPGLRPADRTKRSYGGAVFRCLPALLLALSPVAGAQERYASEPQPVAIEDTYDVFSAIAFDTGWWPNAGDPITVRFHLTPTGGVVTAMEAESWLEWEPGTHPEGMLEQATVGLPGTGFLAVDTGIEIAGEIGIDIFGLWAGTVPLWTEQVQLFQADTFDPMLLDQPPAEVLLAGNGLIDPLEFEITVFTGLDVVLAVEVYPELEASVSGLRVESHTEDGAGVQLSETDWAELAPPDLATDWLPIELTYVAQYAAGLTVIIEPSVSLDTFIGQFQLASFPIDVPLTDETGERAFPPVTVAHPLPILGPLPAELDAGEVALEGLANVPVTVSNEGALPLEGTARIVGSNDFTVFPEEVYIGPGGTSGVMVSFAPILDGERQVFLEIASNDPVQPVVQIPLFGTGRAPEPDNTRDDGAPDDLARVNGEELDRGCGCTTPTPTGGLSWALLGLLLLTRRRGDK